MCRSQLEVLDLSGNELTGSIPAELGNLTTLDRLFVQWNRLSGIVPLTVAEVGVGATRCAMEGNSDLYMPGTPDYLALGDPICGIALTPLEDLATDVTSQIANLVASGELVSGLGNALTNHFEKALEMLNAGKTAPAISMLQGLIDQIDDLITDGRISAAEGENLILLATALMP